MMALDWQDPFAAGADPQLVGKAASSHGGKGGIIILIIKFWPFALMGFSAYFGYLGVCILKDEIIALRKSKNSKKELNNIDWTLYRSDFPLVKQVDIETVESENMVERDHWPEPLAFGFMNAEWLNLKNTAQENDELWYYSSSKESWERLAGRAGYVLIRGDIVVASIQTTMN